MINKWVTSDNHFFHKNILKLQPNTRPFETVEAMHEVMITTWNNTVNPEDEVYILGDFSFAGWNKTKEILFQLNGVKHLIIGNHDNWVVPEAKQYLESIQHYLETRIEGLDVVMMHYPIAQWNKMQYGAIHLHGHSHGHYHVEGRIFDVGIDNRPTLDFGLWNLKELVIELKDNPIIRRW